MLGAVRRWLTRCLPTTTAGRLSAVVALLLIATVLIGWTAFTEPDSPGFSLAMPWGRVAFVLALLFAIPAVLYYLVSTWDGHVTESSFSDVDQAWRPGVDALKNAGFSLHSLPIFLLLGSTGDRLERPIMQAMKSAGLDLIIEDVPSGAGVDHALRWYATKDAIYLFCSEVGALSKLAKQWASVAAPAARTCGFDAPAGPEPVAIRPQGPAKQPAPYYYPSLVVDTAETPRATGDQDEHAAPAPKPQPNHSFQTPPDRLPRQATRAAAGLPSDIDIEMASRRLRYVCQLLQQGRRPHCAINGVVTLLPFELTLVKECGRELKALVESIRADLQTVQEALSLRFPVTALVVGMERTSGFTQFVELLGRGQSANRLGRRFDTRRLPTRERLRRLIDGICDGFEDWVYALFQRRDALERHAANAELYSLLCRLRQQVKPKLNATIGQAFDDTNTDRTVMEDSESSLLFSGCYLGATGSSAKEQAFLRGLHDKLTHEQANVAWTRKARGVDSLIRRIFLLGWLAFAGTLVALVAVICKILGV